MIIGRTHISKSSIRGFLDVTTRAAQGSLGRKFAPQWAWVAGLKGIAGYPKLSWAEYTTLYLAFLDSIPYEVWVELSLFGKKSGGTIRFACFCSPTSMECHTELLVQYLTQKFPQCKREQLSLPMDDLPEFRVIVCGGRDFDDYQLMERQLDSILSKKLKSSKVVIVSGCARGADSLAIKYATTHNLSVLKFPADWETNGRAAGFIRNGEMLKVAHAVVAFPGGNGTRDMVSKATQAKIPTRVIGVPPAP